MLKKTIKHKPVFTTQAPRDEAPRHHFFLSSVGAWRTGYNLPALIQYMKKDKLPFNIYMVPGPETLEYKIEYFAPLVEGTVWLGHQS
jgi:hypothetical protein